MGDITTKKSFVEQVLLHAKKSAEAWGHKDVYAEIEQFENNLPQEGPYKIIVT